MKFLSQYTQLLEVNVVTLDIPLSTVVPDRVPKTSYLVNVLSRSNCRHDPGSAPTKLSGADTIDGCQASQCHRSLSGRNHLFSVDSHWLGSEQMMISHRVTLLVRLTQKFAAKHQAKMCRGSFSVAGPSGMLACRRRQTLLQSCYGL